MDERTEHDRPTTQAAQPTQSTQPIQSTPWAAGGVR